MRRLRSKDRGMALKVFRVITWRRDFGAFAAATVQGAKVECNRETLVKIPCHHLPAAFPNRQGQVDGGVQRCQAWRVRYRPQTDQFY